MSDQDFINKLEQKVHELETDVKHLDNELRLTMEENEESTRKYFDLYCKLEKKVKDRTQKIEETNKKLKIEAKERELAENEREKLIIELQKTLEEVKTLSGFLPICASCKKIRDDKGYWSQVEEYIKKHSGVEFSHSICPDCAKKLYSDIELYKEKQKNE